MSLALFPQFHEALKRAKSPVIVLSANPTIDDFTAAFTVVAFCKTFNVPCDIVTEHGESPRALKFLSIFQDVASDLGAINALTLRIDLQHARVDGLVYAIEGSELVVTVTPKTGSWRPSDVAITTNDYRYDCIIMIGTADRLSAGTLFSTYSDFFLTTPIIVLDCSPANEQFGAINVVDITATSIAEVCFSLFTTIDPAFVDSTVATALLTGMMSKTKSFRAPNVTPRTLEVAQKLMEKKADREAIVEHLYRTRSVETLRLWGRALARLKADETIGLVWTLITKQDFVNAGANADALRDIADELLMTSPSAKIAVILFENHDSTIAAHLHATRPHDALALGSPFHPVGTSDIALLSFTETDIVAAEKMIVIHLRSKLA